MKIVLFDLGNTLEDSQAGGLVVGVLATLTTIRAMRDSAGRPPVLALVSDFGNLNASPSEIRASRREYLKIIKDLGIRPFFGPVERRVTISAEVNAEKPALKIFKAVLNKAGGVRLQHVLFITELKSHVVAARALGMQAVHFKGPSQTTGEITTLSAFVPMVQKF